MTSPTPALTLQELLALFPKWYVGTEVQRAACTWVPPKRSFVVTDEGNLYIADGQRMVKDLPLVGGSSQNFVINDTVTATGSVWSSQHTSDEISAAVTAAGAGSYDPAGAATQAQNNAEAYADAKLINGKSGHNITLAATDVGAVPTTQVGAANGVASLDGNVKVPVAQIPDLSATYASSGAVAAAQTAATNAQTTATNAQSTANAASATASAALQPLNSWQLINGAYTAVDRDALFLDSSGGGAVAVTLGDLADKARVRLKWTNGPAVPASNPPSLVAGALSGGGTVTIDASFGGFGSVGTVIELTYQKSTTTWYVIDAFRPSVVDVQQFTANGTWYKPSGAKRVIVEGIAPGGAGGSGARMGTGIATSGGAGGGGGGYFRREFIASDLPATVQISIGSPGTGGAAVTADSTAGNAGGNGGKCQFGSAISAYYAWASGGSGGGGGQSGAAASQGAFGNGGLFNGTNGAASSSTGGAGNSPNSPTGGAGPGGAAGGGLNTSNAFSSGGNGAAPVAGTGVNPAGGATDGAAGTSGTQQAAPNAVIAGTSGGGGASSVAGPGGAGGAGGAYGAGGAGGGASRNGQPSGPGGNGGPGFMSVTSLF